MSKKCLKMYPNDKPWINGELKAALKKKRRAFQLGDSAQVKVMQKEIRQVIIRCKHD